MPESPPSDVLFEFAKIGTSMRVTVVDAATGTEVVVQGHASTSMEELRRVGLSKLQYVLKKKQAEKR